jgi:hypothetical protein
MHAPFNINHISPKYKNIYTKLTVRFNSQLRDSAHSFNKHTSHSYTKLRVTCMLSLLSCTQILLRSLQLLINFKSPFNFYFFPIFSKAFFLLAALANLKLPSFTKLIPLSALLTVLTGFGR